MEDVKSFALGRGESQPPVMLSALQRLSDKLGRRLRVLIEPISGVRPEVEAEDVQLVDYADWAASVPEFVSMSVYRVAPLKGQLLLRLDAAMISTLVDCFYGGIGNRPLPQRGEFTPTEDRLIARLSESIVTRLIETWADIVPLDAALLVREPSLSFSPVAEAGDQMVLHRFRVSVSRDQEWPIDLLLPLAALRGIEPLMGSRVIADEEESDPAWRASIARRMRDIRLPARTVLARPELSLAELMQLKQGDIIPVTIGRNLPLIVGNRIVAHGSIGEQDGRAAFQIEKLVQETEQ